jgi:hypothetical protein
MNKKLMLLGLGFLLLVTEIAFPATAEELLAIKDASGARQKELAGKFNEIKSRPELAAGAKLFDYYLEQRIKPSMKANWKAGVKLVDDYKKKRGISANTSKAFAVDKVRYKAHYGLVDTLIDFEHKFLDGLLEGSEKSADLFESVRNFIDQKSYLTNLEKLLDENLGEGEGTTVVTEETEVVEETIIEGEGVDEPAEPAKTVEEGEKVETKTEEVEGEGVAKPEEEEEVTPEEEAVEEAEKEPEEIEEEEEAKVPEEVGEFLDSLKDLFKEKRDDLVADNQLKEPFRTEFKGEVKTVFKKFEKSTEATLVAAFNAGPEEFSEASEKAKEDFETEVLSQLDSIAENIVSEGEEEAEVGEKEEGEVEEETVTTVVTKPKVVKTVVTEEVIEGETDPEEPEKKASGKARFKEVVEKVMEKKGRKKEGEEEEITEEAVEDVEEAEDEPEEVEEVEEAEGEGEEDVETETVTTVVTEEVDVDEPEGEGEPEEGEVEEVEEE